MESLNFPSNHGGLSSHPNFFFSHLKEEACCQYEFLNLVDKVGEENALAIVNEHQQFLNQNCNATDNPMVKCPLLKSYELQVNTPATGFKTKVPVSQQVCSVFYPLKTKLYRPRFSYLSEIAEQIKGPNFAAKTKQLGSITDEVERKQFEEDNFYRATFSGAYAELDESKLLKTSGLICISLDQCGKRLDKFRSLVNAEPLTVMSFKSADGDGLRVLFQITPYISTQSDYYKAYSILLRELCGLPWRIDFKVTKMSQACYLPHDPEVYVHPNLSAL
ncbi:hypothetical protein AHMF7605_11285 [Adhaeribacter arboris]|uniref:BT4734-like N-terminal domain-containing protein n=1 Tax=Adhaeribacter arboris TaxID=2072846 RepID=A0A2T2YEW9_9BACT|nr:BT4734/BF3469 family protein [Adhaeribacter arboris]PSR54061.1 hypothetical protein AHMF7605_11285 [Adhaeribacter arboris]